MDKRVLFIDDELEEWEGALREELGEFGFELRGEEDPSKALKAITTFKPDVVLLDILFPDGYLGKTTLEKIKKKYPNLPVMMITSTMDKSEYKTDDYLPADYRYAKVALAGGNFDDLAAQLDKLIEKAKLQEREKDDDKRIARFGFIVGKTKAMLEVAEMVEKVANQDHTVIIIGASGTGKELMARFIHKASSRWDHDFITVVCAALPKDLLESELFGHEKGAFTGAISQKKGKFEIAGGGTIFLDEIGEMPLDTQVKLLRFLQEGQFERVGGNMTLLSNARIIAATNRDPKELITKGKFREDLYFRLNVLPIHMPPLKDRRADIPLFFEHFVKKSNKDSKKNVLSILRDDVRDLLLSYSWPGNIRELENLINRSIALSDENILQVSNFPDLTKENANCHVLPSDISYLIDRIFKGKLAWTDLSKEFAARGSVKKELILGIIDRCLIENQHRPSSMDLAALLSVSHGNMRRILSEFGIRLTEIT